MKNEVRKGIKKNMHTKKGLFGIIFVTAFCLSLSLNVKAQDNDIEEEIKEQILKEYENDKEFERMQAYSSEVALYLNNFVSSYKYAYVDGQSISKSQFQDKIWNSLVHNRPVLLHAITSPLSYYGGKKLYHYLSLDTYNRETYTVTIKDCNYDSRYGGTHTQVSVDEAFETITMEPGRYLIYGQ